MAVMKVTDAELERLALFSEEAGEAQQVIGKILRHGFQSSNPLIEPHLRVPNRLLLEKEAGDILAALDLLVASGDLDICRIEAARNAKHDKLPRWLHHQPAKLMRTKRGMDGVLDPRD